MVSNVTGDFLTDDQATSAQYWGEQLRSPVRFADAMDRLLSDGVDCFFELSPDRSMRALVGSAAPQAVSIPALTTSSGDHAADLLEALTTYWLAGGEVEWAALYASEPRRRQSLPLYPFARTRHWVDAQPALRAPVPASGERGLGAARSGRLAGPVEPASGRTQMQAYLTLLWLDLLGGQDIGIHDNFFEVGGHSLLAMQMVTVLRRDGAEDLAMTTVFEVPTIARLADYLEGQGVTPPASYSPPDAGSAPGADSNGAQAAAMPGAQLAGLVASVEAMSDEEVEAYLARMEGPAQ